jgi:hypothetical protein
MSTGHDPLLKRIWAQGRTPVVLRRGKGGTAARATAIRRDESSVATGRELKQAAVECQVQVLGSAEVVV